MAFLQEFHQRPPVFSAFGRAAPVGSCLILQHHPPWILERLPFWSDKRHHCLVPIGGAGVSTTVGEGVMGVGLPIGVASWAVIAKRAAKDMFPISNCKGTLVPPDFCGTGLLSHPTCLQKGLAIPPFLPYGLTFQVLHTLIKGPLQGTGMIHTGSLQPPMVAVHLASASQIAAMQRTLASLMAVSVLDTRLLWQESMEALVVSSCPMSSFISPW